MTSCMDQAKKVLIFGIGKIIIGYGWLGYYVRSSAGRRIILLLSHLFCRLVQRNLFFSHLHNIEGFFHPGNFPVISIAVERFFIRSFFLTVR